MEYDSLMTRLKWKVEKAFLELHFYELFKRLTDEGTIYLGCSRVSTNLHGQLLMDVAERFKECRLYDTAIEILDKAKELYQRNYDFNTMQIPLERQVSIYKTMSQDKRVEHATYFKLSFIGRGHLDEYRNKDYIYRAKANKLISGIEDKLLKRFDSQLIIIEDKWPTEEDINSNKKYCHISKVKPLTYKEILNFQLRDLEDE